MITEPVREPASSRNAECASLTQGEASCAQATFALPQTPASAMNAMSARNVNIAAI